tara:strand:+ start:4339 stop:4980 length:642 start_codon:yes stop_codon:yes gene_type:complete
MSRLFITPREIDFIADLTKEITKDVIGDVIYYYKVREDVSEVHDVYEEAPEKVFDPPVEIDARVQWNPREIRTDRFGYEGIYTTEAYVHYRDMIDRNIKLEEGDYFSYGDNFFEITSIVYDKVIFGQVEHISGYTIKGKQARKGQINFKPHGPTEEIYSDADAVKTEFEQQRGDASKGDKRVLVDQGKIDDTTHVKQQVKEDTSSSSFYGDDT